MGSDVELSTSQVNSDKKIQPKQFACHYKGCLSAFNRQWKLDRHICCAHTKERPFKCTFPDCEKDYTSKAHLQRHVTVSHKKGNVTPVYISCPYPECFKQFQNKYSLKKHYKSHVSESAYKCTECSLTFKKRSQLTFHLYKHQACLLYKCTQCGKGFPSELHLSKHEKKHKEYICEYSDCREKFTAWTFLRAHTASKHQTRYMCDICNCTCVTKFILTKHILNHLDDTDQKVYPCPYEDCLKYYKFRSNLKHHIQTIHEGKSFKCTEENCTHIFKSKNRLVDHLKRHETGRLNVPRIITKDRKPRKDKGLRKKSAASLLSGVVLHPKVDKILAQKGETPLVEESIKCTLDNLKELASLEESLEKDETDNSISEETAKVETSDSSKSVLCI